MKRVGVYAGTFDPIHVGHVAFAERALEQGLDMVYFLPEPRPRRKQGVRALEHRVGMIEAAIQPHPKLGVIHLKQARFTPHETLPILHRRFPGADITLLFGDDVLTHIASWPLVEELVGNVELLIATRNGNRGEIDRKFATLNSVSGLKFSYHIIDAPHNHVSSSVVRGQLRAGDNHVEHLPAAVADYIKQHRLYRPAKLS
jgi:nicotinate-nucleotide adenylyltransferase